ncbi:hypothetical protein HNV27_01185 [Myxococcus xanthus]|nr:hypothetical protein [Myxococcus xanthus]
MSNRNTHLSLAYALAALALGCSNSATGISSRRDMDPQDAYAQAACLDSATCCIQRFGPDACGLSATEAAVLMAGSQVAAEADAPDVDDAHNTNLPEWKRRCIATYAECKDDDWQGSCYACFRYCEGQQEWPINKCRPRRGKR